MTIKPGKYDPLKPDIELFDFKSKRRYGLKLSGSSAMQIGTVSQDDSVLIRNAGKRVGDFDEQRSWKGGRGVEKLSDNAEAFWDSGNAWTMTDGHVHQTLLWQFAIGLRSQDFFMPDKTHSMSWMQLVGSSLYLSTSWSSSGFTADRARIWIRKVGNPGVLTLNLHSNNAGVPGTILKTATITTVSDVVSVLQSFDWTGTQVLSASTTYHISIVATSADNKSNHWEIGGYSGGTTGKMSTDGTTWVSASFNPYYSVVDADVSRTWFHFFLDEAMYVVDKKDNGSASVLYINGDRGKASTASSNSLGDGTKSWVTNIWAGARVKIIRGTGSGQNFEILNNNSNTITFTTTVDYALDATSEYVIYATQVFTLVPSTGIVASVKSKPLVVNRIAYFPLGTGNLVRKMVWNTTTSSYAFSDEASGTRANYMTKTQDSSGNNVVWYAALNNLYYATAVIYSGTPSALTFSSAIAIGEDNDNITGLCEKDSTLFVFKSDGVWNINSAYQVIAIQNGMKNTPSQYNGSASIAHQQFLFFSWLHSVIRVYGSSYDDVGQDWSGYGLPDGREGVFSAFDSYTSLLIGAVNAGSDGVSSVLAFDGIGWHEMFRSFQTGARIRSIKIQPCEDTRNRLWIAAGGELVYQEMPLKKGSPRLDSGVRYFHEAVIESSAIDMGTASSLPKFVKELTIYCENLGSNNQIKVDYQVDEDVHTSNWTEASTAFVSPESTVYLGLYNIRKFAYRLRIMSSDNTKPVDVQGVIPNGYARAPYKMVWTLRCKADNITSRGRLVKPDALMRWLLDTARYPGRVEMASQYELAHKFAVIVHPPRMFPFKPASGGQAEESVFTIVLEEC